MHVPRRSGHDAWPRCAPGWRASSAPTPSSSPTATSRRSQAAVEEAQIEAIADALARVAERVPAGTAVVAVGVGAFLARAAAERCGLSVHADSGSPLVGQGGEVAAAVALSVLGRD